MLFLRNLIVAFSLYSRIPVPIFEWQEADMKYNLVFLPWVGAVIGALVAGAVLGMRALGLALVPQLLLASVLPLLVTGGFHVDGFMDTQDALNSYRPREEKLRILKDPHIGAFAVISLLAFSLVWGAALYLVLEEAPLQGILQLGLIFPLVRGAAGLTSLCFAHARKDGMLNTETSGAAAGCRWALAAELAVAAVFVLASGWRTGLGMLAGLAGFTWVYHHRCTKAFGGVTGDTTGWFVTTGELVCLVLAALGGLLWK